jgi:hypothetical protein
MPNGTCVSNFQYGRTCSRIAPNTLA